jgi:predicted anti-sigma-YlaC factor YlaD
MRPHTKLAPLAVFAALTVLLALGASSCSINTMAINKVSDMLGGGRRGTEGGTPRAFTGDNDPELVGKALPFALKLYEVMLEKNPKHLGLLLTTGSLYVMYANAFVQGPADMLPPDEVDARDAERQRAKNLYLRGENYVMDALEEKYPGFRAAKVADGTLQPLLAKCTKDDVPFLYWAVAGGLSAYAINVFDFSLGQRIPELTAMINRAYELNPDFNTEAIDEFYILFYSALPEIMGGDMNKAKAHYKIAVEKSKGNFAGPYVAYAESVCVPAQDYDGYKDALEKALAVNLDAAPEMRLQNVIGQKKAKWLLDNAWQNFSSLPMPDEDDEAQ